MERYLPRNWCLLTGLEGRGIDFNLATCDWLEGRELRLVEVRTGGETGASQTPLLGFLLLIHRHQLKKSTNTGWSQNTHQRMQTGKHVKSQISSHKLKTHTAGPFSCDQMEFLNWQLCSFMCTLCVLPCGWGRYREHLRSPAFLQHNGCLVFNHSLHSCLFAWCTIQPLLAVLYTGILLYWPLHWVCV